MKIKYMLERDEKNGQLTIKEYGELDKDLMSLLCEETFDPDVIAEAIQEGIPALVAALRSDNLYPPGSHATKIAESVVALYASDGQRMLTVVFDDKDMMAKERKKAEQIEDLKEDVDLDLDDESDGLDELLDDDDIKIKNTTTSLKIADDESVDIDEGA